MGKDRNGSVQERRSKSSEKEDENERKSGKAIEHSDSQSEEDRKRRKSRRKARESSELSDEKRVGSDRRKRRSRRRYSSESDSDSDSKSESEESGSDSASESESDSESDSDRRRKRKRRKEKDDDRERKRRRREKEKKRRREEERKKKKEKRKKKGKKGAVTDSWGKYGIIRETDMWNKRPEFTARLAEVKQISRNCLFPMALSTQIASTSRTSAEWAPPHWKHDVFLSFWGEDTRRGFISHLYHELQYCQAIETFKDDRDLEIGATISPELLTAIEQSHLAIIVLSPNYASSTWCLDELSKILECMQDTMRILPIFYHVDPSDVRNQSGSFAEAFTKHEEKFSEDVDKLKRWRDALKEVVNLAGLDSKNHQSEAELIIHIVKCVWTKVHPTFMLSGSLDNLVGIDSALEQLHLHLAPKDNDVRFIGIWGMAGLGKTTLARLVFERNFYHFELRWFLSNVSRRQGDLVELQRQILFPILKEHVACVWDEIHGTYFIQNFLWNKKVLLVLDDVGQLNQLEKLVGNKKWFGAGSRIIITTRDERLLVEHGIAIRYKVELLKDDKALELFCRLAFKKEQPDEGFQELSQHFLNYANGLPLALKILGLSLYGRSQDTWKSALYYLNKIPNPTVFHSLKVSYDGLEKMEKKIFLHVACLHRGKNKEQVIQILDSSFDICSRSKIDILIEKSLLTIEERHRSIIVEMHDLIKEMARTIVHEESPKEPGKRSILRSREDIFDVLRDNKGTGAIEAIVLDLPELEAVPWNCTEAFNEMQGLRLLEFYNVMFSSGPKFLPNSLRIIHWSWYPSKSLPSGFEPHLLSKLEMRNSKLVRLWDGAQDFPNLKYMNLSCSENLISILDFTRIPNLEKLNLEGCKKLGEVHSSIAVHKKLKVLLLSGCKSIKSLPRELQMDSLELLSLSSCSKLKKIPEFGEHMQKLKEIFLSSKYLHQLNLY